MRVPPTRSAHARIEVCLLREDPCASDPPCCLTAPRHAGTLTERNCQMVHLPETGLQQRGFIRIFGLAIPLALLAASTGFAQVDPGIRDGPPGAGQAFTTG